MSTHTISSIIRTEGTKEEYMEYVDPVHGLQRYPSIVRAIINTAQFQRLRHVRQLGVCNFVFAGSDHTRYEHCIGVCTLVMRYMDILEANTPNRLPNHDFYKLCVILAGLLHDIGHGPFSHMWESVVHNGIDKHWTHEDASCDVVEHLFATSGIRLCPDDVQHATGVRLISALIRCNDHGDRQLIRDVLGNDLHYLSEIVNNKYCLIDVDKWDYLLRDAHYLRTSIAPAFEPCFRRASVRRTADGCMRIAFHLDTVHEVRALFATRAHFHRRFYQNTSVMAVQTLLEQIFAIAEIDGYRFKGEKLTLCHQNMNTFQLLDDSVLTLIENSIDGNMRRAQDLIRLLRDHKYAVDYEPVSQMLDDAIAQNKRQCINASCLPDGRAPSLVTFYDDNGDVFEMDPNTDI